MLNNIFVQVASYRDPDLYNTIMDMFAKAKYPDNLSVCICWQNSREDCWEDKSRLKSYGKKIKVLDIPYKESLGVCWARNMVQKQYGGEKYTLQIDSHHRFIDGWDEELIKMIEKIRSNGYSKPLLTSYAPSFSPEKYPDSRHETPWKMNFDRFIPEGAVFFIPSELGASEKNMEFIPARFYSAHFAFADGVFCKEVKHDPGLYFHGEEITISVRAFTNGYDIFHPNKIILWHEYTRKNRKKHWDDHYEWTKINKDSHLRAKKLLGVDGIESDIAFGEYGLGEKRSLSDYEKYAGIKFRTRSVTKDTITNNLPNLNNINYSDEEFENSLMRVFKHCIDLDKKKLTQNSDYDFWCVVFKDKGGKDLQRLDADSEEISTILNNDEEYIKLWREFLTDRQPCSWVVWPHSVSKGWLEPITGSLN